MTMRKHVASVRFLLSGLLVFTCPASSVAETKTQAPCVAQGHDYCLTFGSGQSIPVIRQFSFDAPGKGAATVTFHGSMYCYSDAVTLFDFNSQIVANGAVLADAKAPGGLKHRFYSGGAADAPFNLGSTRVFAINAAGTQNYFFKLRKIQMLGTGCFVYNAAFTVNFDP